MPEVTHSSTTQMSGNALADHILDGSYGFQTSNATVNISDVEHNMYIDGQSIISDGTLVLTTNASKKIIFGVDSTEYLQITTDGALDILSEKLLINGNSGSSNQVLTTDGFGNISWATPITQQNAFGNITISGQDTVQADQAGDSLNLVAGSGITINSNGSTDTITISSSGTGSGGPGFRYINVGSDSVEADNASGAVEFIAGSNVTLNADASNDTITISANTSGELNQNSFKNISTTNQNTVTAGATEDTLRIESEENTSLDNRYKSDRDKVTITTDATNNEVKVTSNVPKTLSLSSKVPIILQAGEGAGVPLRNKFFNVATSDPVSGSGGYVGVSTRSIPVLQSNGTLADILMPAKTDNSTLQLSIVQTNGSEEILDMEVAE
jgi:hypothetical protein|tara:strand:- start:893 stop:2044 length:1152 start_codon:yes stop_codon:yes gene_type:complete